MKNKKEYYKRILKKAYDKNMKEFGFVLEADLIAEFFLLKPLPIATEKIMKKKWAAKKHHVKSLISEL